MPQTQPRSQTARMAATGFFAAARLSAVSEATEAASPELREAAFGQSNNASRTVLFGRLSAAAVASAESAGDRASAAHNV